MLWKGGQFICKGKTNRGEGRSRKGVKWRWREAAVIQLWGGEGSSQRRMFLCVQNLPFGPCLQLLCEVSSLDLAFWGREAPSGACWVLEGSSCLWCFLNPGGRGGERPVMVLAFLFPSKLHSFPLLYLVPLLVILPLASISVLAAYDGAEMTRSGATASQLYHGHPRRVFWSTFNSG